MAEFALLSSITLLGKVVLFFFLPVSMFGLRLTRGLSPSQTVGDKTRILHSVIFVQIFSRFLSTIIGNTYSVMLEQALPFRPFKMRIISFPDWNILNLIKNIHWGQCGVQAIWSSSVHIYEIRLLKSSSMPLVTFYEFFFRECEEPESDCAILDSLFHRCSVPNINLSRLCGSKGKFQDELRKKMISISDKYEVESTGGE